MAARDVPRISFDPETQVMEISLAAMRVRDNAHVGRTYDFIEDRIIETGRLDWFFLIELGDFYVSPSVWSTWAARGRLLNLGHSLGTTRYGAAPEVAQKLTDAGQAEGFDPALFDTRDAALHRLHQLREEVQQKPTPPRSHRFHDLFPRVSFDHAETIVHIDLSDLTFRYAGDVQDFYNHLETRILCMAPQLKWFFLVNYTNCVLLPNVVSQFALNGHEINRRYSLGSARFGVAQPLEDEFHLRGESRNLPVNIFATQEDALSYLRRLKGGQT